MSASLKFRRISILLGAPLYFIPECPGSSLNIAVSLYFTLHLRSSCLVERLATETERLKLMPEPEDSLVYVAHINPTRGSYMRNSSGTIRNLRYFIIGIPRH